MSLIPLTLDVIGMILKNQESTGCPSRRVLSLGYPDVLADEGHLRAFFGEEIARKVAYRDDSAEILRWHSVGHLLQRVPDAVSLFVALGHELDVVDVATARGGEIIHDLNTRVPEAWRQRYALVIDAGTLEHCFNIGQAAKNVAEMVAPGGAVMHGNPLNMFNHGFYNLNPTWYHDFYEENGFVVEFFRLVEPGLDSKLRDVPPHGRFSGVPENSTLLTVARRDQVRDIAWPGQHKYRKNPGLRG